MVLLYSSDTQVQTIFSLNMASHKEHSKAAIADTISQMQTRSGDTGSTPVQSELSMFHTRLLSGYT